MSTASGRAPAPHAWPAGQLPQASPGQQCGRQQRPPASRPPPPAARAHRVAALGVPGAGHALGPLAPRQVQVVAAVPLTRYHIELAVPPLLRVACAAAVGVGAAAASRLRAVCSAACRLAAGPVHRTAPWLRTFSMKNSHLPARASAAAAAGCSLAAAAGACWPETAAAGGATAAAAAWPSACWTPGGLPIRRGGAVVVRGWRGANEKECGSLPARACHIQLAWSGGECQAMLLVDRAVAHCSQMRGQANAWRSGGAADGSAAAGRVICGAHGPSPHSPWPSRSASTSHPTPSLLPASCLQAEAMVCSCGKCIAGCLSPRMALRLQRTAESAASMIVDSVDWAGEWPSGQTPAPRRAGALLVASRH